MKKLVLMILVVAMSATLLAPSVFAAERPDADTSFTVTDITYYRGSTEVDTLTDGEITAKATVTNDLEEGTYSVSMITVEYQLLANGMKKALQVDKDTFDLAPGASHNFETALSTECEEGIMVQTMIVADDRLEPIGPACQLAYGTQKKYIYLNNEIGDENTSVSVFQINRFFNPTVEFVTVETDEEGVNVSIFDIAGFEE